MASVSLLPAVIVIGWVVPPMPHRQVDFAAGGSSEKMNALAPPAKSLVYTKPGLAKSLTTIWCLPATAPEAALAVNIPLSDEVAVCAATRPTFPTAPARRWLSRQVTINRGQIVDGDCRVRSSFCQVVNWPLLSLIT